MKNNILRKLAKSSKYQLMYSSAKTLNHIRLFRNEMDLTLIQLLFLHWLSVYNSLYTDLAMNKTYISEDVINDEIRTDAYLLYREKQDSKPDQEKETDNHSAGSVIFTTKGEK